MKKYVKHVLSMKILFKEFDYIGFFTYLCTELEKE